MKRDWLIQQITGPLMAVEITPEEYGEIVYRLAIRVRLSNEALEKMLKEREESK